MAASTIPPLPTTPMDADPAPGETPKRRGRPPGSKNRQSAANTGETPTIARLRTKVQIEIYAYLSLAANGWALIDEDCAAPLFQQATIPTATGPQKVERLEAIADRITAIIARNPELLEKFAKTGVVGDIVTLIVLIAPVAKNVISAHGPGGHGHEPDRGVKDDLNAYPAWSGA